MARECGRKITALQNSWGGVTSGGDLLQLPSLKNPCKQFKNSPKFFSACLPIPGTSCAMTETVVDSRSVSLDVSCWLWSAAVPSPACLPLCLSQAECQGFPPLRGNFLGSRPHFHLVFQRKEMLGDCCKCIPYITSIVPFSASAVGFHSPPFRAIGEGH